MWWMMLPCRALGVRPGYGSARRWLCLARKGSLARTLIGPATQTLATRKWANGECRQGLQFKAWPRGNEQVRSLDNSGTASGWLVQSLSLAEPLGVRGPEPTMLGRPQSCQTSAWAMGVVPEAAPMDC